MFDYRPAPLRPDDVPLFATAGGFLILDRRLLLERRPPDVASYPGMWDTPGGHLESGESPEQCLVREFDEELGIAVTEFRLALVQDHREAASGRFYRHWHYIVDRALGDIVNREDKQLAWHALDDVAGLDGLNPLIRSAFVDIVGRGWLQQPRSDAS